MRVFLVRNFHTKHLLGLFWAATRNDLWWEVDGHIDPSDYEYAPLSHGGLYFYDKEPVLEQVPSDDTIDQGALEEWEPKPIPWHKATPSELLWGALHSNAGFRFRRFPYADAPGGGVRQLVTEHGSKIRGVQ
jgi:hypothetical protein